MNGRYCVVIPAFNAAGTIGQLVKRVMLQGFDVIVVDDGSKDATASVASAQGALVISHVRNKGKGRALRTAFEYVLRSRYDGVITMDGDGQHDPAEIPRLVREGELQHAGIVTGNRLANPAVSDEAIGASAGGSRRPAALAAKGGIAPAGLHGVTMPLARRWTNRLMSAIVSAVAHQPIPDTQCGFRFIRREVLADISLRARRFEIETELLFNAASRRWKIISVPVQSIYQDERSHIRPLRDGIRFVRMVLNHIRRGTWT